MITKQYILAAWTEQGQVFTETGEEVKRHLMESCLHEIAADFFLRENRPGYAFGELMEAAEVCTNCKATWLQGEDNDGFALLLLQRFLLMHKRCVEIVDESPWLHQYYEGSRLHRDYLFLTGDARDTLT